MPFTGNIGDTFYGIGPGTRKAHLNVIISRRIGEPPEVVVTFITTHAPFKDQTTVLLPGENQHDFIKHTSIVSYEDAQLVSLEAIEAALESGEYTFHESSFPPDELKRIIDGLLGSPRTDQMLKKFLISQHQSGSI